MPALDERTRFGHALRALRTERGWSQEELARLTGLHRNYIGGLERGERNPSLSQIYRVARAFGLAGSELLARAEAIEAP